MEPERHIEKLLRAVAKKRREQAGEPFELHPAARQELLREAASRGAKKSGGGFFAQIFSSFRPRLTLALTVVVVVAVGVWLVRPLLREKPEASMLSALSERDDRAARRRVKSETVNPAAPMPGSAAPVVAAEPNSDVNVDVTTPAGTARSSGEAAAKDGAKKQPVPLASKPAPSNKEEANRKVALAANSPIPGGATHSVAQGEIAAASTVTAAPPSVSAPAANSEKTWATDSTTAGNAPAKRPNPAARTIATNRIAPSMTVAAANREAQKSLKQALPQPAPMNSLDYAGNNQMAGKLASNSQRFTRVITAPPMQQRLFGGSRSTVTPLLTSFRMERNGQEIRVIDADGSVYTGSWQVTPQQDVPPAATPAPARAGGWHLFESQTSASRAAVPPVADDNSEAIMNYSFTVSGTNRNLKQKITFSGKFIPLTNASNATNNTAGVDGLAGERTAPALNSVPPALLNSRIAGKAVIGQNQQIEVNANPAP